MRCATLLAALTVASLVTPSLADPLPGRDQLKFSQVPMVQTFINDQPYFGHDELSTAFRNPASPLFRGVFMADDFADKITAPIVHVRWWGSYLNLPSSSNGVERFLVAFESDVTPPESFSRPGEPLLTQVLSRGALAPGSGTFTEKLIRGPDPKLGEALYEYNGELHLDKAFVQKENTVYWLKIVAMVDTQSTFPLEDPNVVRWGWHNRDYTKLNTFASTPPQVVPGEDSVGFVGIDQKVYHFQDDAVQGNIDIDVANNPQMPLVRQTQMFPKNYIDMIDGPAGVTGLPGIGQFSKDLAFQLYTVPEPSTWAMLAMGAVGLFALRRRK